MILRLVVLLLVLAYVIRRFVPRYRLAWYAPLVIVGVILAVRTGGYLLGEDASATRR